MNNLNDCINELNKKITQAITENDINLIQNILLPNSFTELTQEEKEEEVFKNVRLSFSFLNKGQKILEYLIFDYDLSEVYNNKYKNKNYAIEHMFLLRKLNKEFS
jgi:hypothetical protein